RGAEGAALANDPLVHGRRDHDHGNAAAPRAEAAQEVEPALALEPDVEEDQARLRALEEAQRRIDVRGVPEVELVAEEGVERLPYAPVVLDDQNRAPMRGDCGHHEATSEQEGCPWPRPREVLEL